MRLERHEVISVGDVECLRVLRNSGREWMTHFREEISPEAQAAWWAGRDFYAVRAYLFTHGGVIVGAGVLSRRDHRTWITLVVQQELRGGGYGTEIYRDLAAAAGSPDFPALHAFPPPVWAEILCTNYRSKNAALAAEYEVVSETAEIVTMMSRKRE